MEYASVFKRTLGEDSDVVMKEMYTFGAQEQEEAICLRPENTAGVIRAILTNKLIYQLPQRLFYFGPMFRHERPQKGRFRQVLLLEY